MELKLKNEFEIIPLEGDIIGTKFQFEISEDNVSVNQFTIGDHLNGMLKKIEEFIDDYDDIEFKMEYLGFSFNPDLVLSHIFNYTIEVTDLPN